MDQLPASDNPFSTRRIKPGAIPYLFSSDESVLSLVDRLRQTNWWGQIVGPHGSGKSTLLASLIPAIESAGHRTILVTLHDGQRRLSPNPRRDPRLCPPVVLIVDGYEQLSHWSRLTLKWFCRRRGAGLLVTSHDPVGLPELCRTTVTPELAAKVVGELFSGQAPPFLLEKASECLARHGGDLRETLMDLYDFYEHWRLTSGQNMT
jgi:hypothetical protein